MEVAWQSLEPMRDFGTKLSKKTKKKSGNKEFIEMRSRCMLICYKLDYFQCFVPVACRQLHRTMVDK